MSDQSYSTTFEVDKTPEEVFAAINDVRAWWSGEITGETDKLGAEFRYRYKEFHDSTQKITELVPGKRVVWHVTKGYLSFVEDKHEWEGTDIIFEISEKDGKTQVRFTHRGIAPQVECYATCSDGWSKLVGGNLRSYISVGGEQPDPFSA